MILDQIWTDFKNSDKSKKDLFVKYCIKNIKENDLGKISIQQASYNICAACMNIPENEISNIKNFDEIQNIACDLELPDEHRERSLDDWGKLKDLINII
jgi:hypothetical protein